MTAPSRSLKELFLAALEVAPVDRAAWLESECAGDAGLREQLCLMLAAHDEPQSLLDRPAQPGAVDLLSPSGTQAVGEPSDATRDPHLTDGAGTIIGPYKLLQQIGEGGMGTVWMAEQTQPVQRKVALKIIKAGMDSKQVIARFEAERQALALMDHPNIAKVLDAGTIPALQIADCKLQIEDKAAASSNLQSTICNLQLVGRPYFVMELVKGMPITKYCDEHRLTPRERLDLFLPVCQAIQHAHQKGIIHRDMKPSNVLLAPYDGRPVVKVIDFGVAKATGQRLTEKTLFTEFGAVIGTLEYMSPEQAELNNQDIDTRSDIYSLGVLLYELLTGSTPLDRKRLKETAFTEMLRMIREEEPPKPSTRLTDSKDALPSISAQRQTEPAKLTKLVRGELDWIVMKALEKDRNHRYETANGLARDVERYLHDEPVLACPPSKAYRFRKWARRHKSGVLAAAALAAVLAAVALGATVVAFREQRLKGEALAKAEELERTLYFERIALAGQRLATDDRDHVDELLEQCPQRWRGWEWRYLKRWLTAEPFVELSGHTSFVSSVAFHPDGTKLASGSGDYSVRIWDRTTRMQLRPTLHGHLDSVMAIAFSSDGHYLASASNDKTVRIWDVATGKTLHTLRGHHGAVVAVEFSPDGQLVASSARDKTVRIWETASARALHTCKGHAVLVSAVAFSPDGRRLASASVDGVVKLWDVSSGLGAFSWQEAAPGWPCVAFRPGGDRLAVACGSAVHIHELTEGRLEATLPGHSRGVHALAFSPDGRRLALGGEDGAVKLWDPDARREILTLRGHTHLVRGVAFSRDGRHLATASNDMTIKIWDAPERAMNDAALVRTVRLKMDKDQVDGRAVAFHPDGRLMAAGHLDGTVRLSDLTSGREDTVYSVGDSAVPISRISPDGSRLAATNIRGAVKVWDLTTGRELWNGQINGAPVFAAFSADSRWLAIGGYSSGAIAVRDATTGHPVATLDQPTDLTWMDFSRDGRLLASCSASRKVKIWKTDTWQELLTLPHADMIMHLRFSPDSRRLATANNDKTVRIWDAATGRELFAFRGHHHPVMSVDFSPDGRALTSTAGAEALVWNGNDGQILRRFRGHAGHIVSARFSPEGRRLFTVGTDGTLKVWDAALSPLDWHGPEARRIVLERFAKLLLRSDVLEALHSDTTLSDDVRKLALQLAREEEDNPGRLAYAAWTLVRVPGQDGAALRRALRWAEAACRFEPEDGETLNTLATAQYRLGRLQEAQSTLTRAEALNAAHFDGPHPCDLAVRALVEIQLGQLEPAQATLARLRDVLTSPQWPDVADETQLLSEAEALLRQKKSE